MNYQLIILDNHKIKLYTNNEMKEFNWYNNDLLKKISLNIKIYIVFIEKIMYHKNLFLNLLDKENIEYEIISKSSIDIKKYIYDIWKEKNKEILNVDKNQIYILLDLKNNSLNISVFEIENTIKKLNIIKIYEENHYVKEIDKTDNYYHFLDVIYYIEKVIKEDKLRGKIIGKIILIGEILTSQEYIKYFYEKYSENIVDVLHQDIKESFEIYLKIKEKKMLDPFNKNELKYFSKEIKLNEFIELTEYKQSITIVEKNERLPIDKKVSVSSEKFIGQVYNFIMEVDDETYNKEINFPFIYFFDEVDFNFIIDIQEKLKINICVNNKVIDIWIINWRE